MNSLSLFSGAGGGLLAEKYLLNWRSIGYVEYNTYCQKVIAQRIKDGFLDEAPIFGDIDDFIESGAAKKYAGFVDVLTGGFPCQPFSVAGNKKGQDDERNKWPQMLQCIRDVRPRYAFLENVPGLLNSGYFGEILSSLAEIGFDARWCVLGADDVGAPHRRKRLWILAYPNAGRIQPEEEVCTRGYASDDGSAYVADTNDTRDRTSQHESNRDWEKINEGWQEQSFFEPSRQSEDVADSEGIGCERTFKPSNPETKGWDRHALPTEGGRSSRENWPTEPDVGRVAHGVASRVDRLKALGNGQVPTVAATAWKLLSG